MTPDASGFVYFIQGEGEGRIKIGWSVDPRRRLEVIQRFSPVALRLLGTFQGSRTDEARAQKLFDHAHSHGEWFEPTAELVAYAWYVGDVGQGPVCEMWSTMMGPPCRGNGYTGQVCGKPIAAIIPGELLGGGEFEPLGGYAPNGHHHNGLCADHLKLVTDFGWDGAAREWARRSWGEDLVGLVDC